MLFSLSKYFKLPNLYKTSLSLIERCFPIIAEFKNFVELDFSSVKIILASSGLFVDSEFQVFHAAKTWLSHKPSERGKHAKDILLKIRLPLLSLATLNRILNKSACSVMDEDCFDVVKDVIRRKKDYRLRTTSRHCGQNNFNFFVAGGEGDCTGQVTRKVTSINVESLSKVNSVSDLNHARIHSEMFCIKGEIYVFGGYNDDSYKPVMPVEKYSPDTNTWQVVAQMYDGRKGFFACSFVDSIYFLGGIGHENCCLVLNTTSKTWREVAGMNGGRVKGSCVAFEGRIVVTGGLDDGVVKLNSVEAYDYIDDSWSNMPSMIEERCFHRSVAIKNKLFSFGGVSNKNIEVFDSRSYQFVLLKCPNDLSHHEISDATSVANKIVMFGNKNGLVLLYDVENDVWSEERCESTRQIKYFSCSKVQKL